jgi:predicted nuclease of restriction endonuclease-like (RecB) superfamily
VILDRQAVESYGTRIIDRLAVDLRSTYPGQRGLSRRNLHYMRAFAAAWPDPEVVQRVVAQLPWRSVIALLDRTDEPDERAFYAERAAAEGWTQPVLLDRIAGNLYRREGAAPSNFASATSRTEELQLRPLAADPYLLDFLQLAPGASERALKDALVGRVTEFLRHLPLGFAYLGRQYRLTVGDDDFYIDLLFYSTRLHRYVVFELKVGHFNPAHVGQLNFYVTAVERQLRTERDDPTVGILLVTEKDDTVVEYALASIDNPLAVASYRYSELPDELRQQLPTATDLTAALSRPEAEDDR